MICLTTAVPFTGGRSGVVLNPYRYAKGLRRCWGLRSVAACMQDVGLTRSASECLCGEGGIG